MKRNRPIVITDDAELKNVSTTYSLSFTGYIVQYGIQSVLFRTFDREKVIPLCKEFAASLPSNEKIYVEEMRCCHKINRFKL